MFLRAATASRDQDLLAVILCASCMLVSSALARFDYTMPKGAARAPWNPKRHCKPWSLTFEFRS